MHIHYWWGKGNIEGKEHGGPMLKYKDNIKMDLNGNMVSVCGMDSSDSG
jgi:hypothetical protein